MSCSAQNKDSRYDSPPSIVGGFDSLINVTLEKRKITRKCQTERCNVYVQFKVSETGEISDVKVIKGQNAEADSMALEIVRDLNMRPGILKGKHIKYDRIIGIPFEKVE